MTRNEAMLLVISGAASAAVITWSWRSNIIRPHSYPPGKTGRDVESVPAPVWLLCTAIAYLGLIEGHWLGTKLPDAIAGAAGSLQHKAMIGLCAQAGGLILGGLVVYLLAARAGPKSGLVAGTPDVARGAGAMLLAAPVCILVAMVSQLVATWRAGTPPDALGHDTLVLLVNQRGSPWTWIIAVGAVLASPVIEEIIYRGLLQSFLLSLVRSTWAAVLGTSAIFTLMHFTVVPARSLPTLLVLSVAMGLAFERTRRLGVPIVMHILFNLGNVIAAILTAR